VSTGFTTAIADLVTHERAEAVVLDCSVYDMSESLFDEIRGDPQLASLPVVVITDTPDEAYFCLWEGFGLDETQAWWDRPARVRTPHRAYHLLTGPVAAACVLPTPVEWRCASLWWPADQAWLVATEIDGYLTYVGAAQAAIEAVLAHPSLDAVPVRPETPLDPSYG